VGTEKVIEARQAIKPVGLQNNGTQTNDGMGQQLMLGQFC
jgi:hypothetical protein